MIRIIMLLFGYFAIFLVISCKSSVATAQCIPTLPSLTCLQNPCTRARCPKFPMAMCKPNFCTCQAEFHLSFLKLDSSSCNTPQLGNPGLPGRSPDQGSCPSLSGLGICVIQCQTSSDCGGNRICCPTSCGRVCLTRLNFSPTHSCPGGLPPTNCVVNPCLFAKCPLFPGAECRQSKCGICKAEFFMNGRDVTSFCGTDPATPLCPDGSRPYNCAISPCRSKTCPRFPYAQCKENYCGGCSAQFLVNGQDVTSQCKLVSSTCPDGSRPYNCQSRPCATATCPQFPSAQCKDNYCGGCLAEFFFNGQDVTSRCTSGTGTTCPDGSQPLDCVINPCLYATCAKYPEAECKENNCVCEAEFFFEGRDVTEYCDSEDVCQLPRDSGNCLASLQRYYFSNVSKKCERFTYGGCQGNDNNFMTLDECEKKCPPLQVDVCQLPKVTGPCQASFQRYHFSNVSQKCEQFTYGGCLGNGNNFETLDECEKECPPLQVDVCQLPKVSGPCQASFQRYYFNSLSQKCEQFTYGGCLGNGNNFETLGECEKECPPLQVYLCQLPKVSGPCQASFQRYYFSNVSQRCEQFTYGGCLGNGNNFETLGECDKKCPPLKGSCPDGSQPLDCVVNPCIYTKCSNIPEAECKEKNCGICEAEFFLGGTDVTEFCDSVSGTGKTCPDGSQPVDCVINPCLYAKCENYPGAECKENNCGTCEAEFFLGGSDVTKFCDSVIGPTTSPTCPDGNPPFNCLVSPCESATCPKYPSAQCKDNFCGGCNAEFFMNGQDVTSQCKSDLCPDGSRPVNCFERPCQSARCPDIPSAECRDSYCGGCNAEFFLNGHDVTYLCGTNTGAKPDLPRCKASGVITRQRSQSLCKNSCMTDADCGSIERCCFNEYCNKCELKISYENTVDQCDSPPGNWLWDRVCENECSATLPCKFGEKCCTYSGCNRCVPDVRFL